MDEPLYLESGDLIVCEDFQYYHVVACLNGTEKVRLLDMKTEKFLHVKLPDKRAREYLEMVLGKKHVFLLKAKDTTNGLWYNCISAVEKLFDLEDEIAENNKKTIN